MKTPTWTVNPETGEVSKVGPFSHGLNALEIKAKTKGEAIAQLLARMARQAKASGPQVFFRNGAYALAWHDGNAWQIETGTLHESRKSSDGSQFPLCIGGGYATIKEGLPKSSFDYYASEDYQKQERALTVPCGLMKPIAKAETA